MISAGDFTLSNITFSPSVKDGNRHGITMPNSFMEEVPIIKKPIWNKTGTLRLNGLSEPLEIVFLRFKA